MLLATVTDSHQQEILWAHYYFALFALVIAAPFFLPNVARADFRVCNGTQNLVGGAIG